MLKQVQHYGFTWRVRRISGSCLIGAAIACLSACNPAPSGDAHREPLAGSSGAEAETSRAIPCALDGAQQFTNACQGELAPQDDRRLVIVRHPDGGFRRFEFVSDGRGLVTADGAAAAQVALQDGTVEVSVGRDRYRFPAKERQDDAVR